MRKPIIRAISLFFVISMLFSMIPVVHAANICITADSVTAEKGTGTQVIEVPVTISDNSGLLGMTMIVSYAEELSLVKVEKGDALKSLTMTKPDLYR